jgi:hypothetical protein
MTSLQVANNVGKVATAKQNWTEFFFFELKLDGVLCMEKKPKVYMHIYIYIYIYIYMQLC